MRLIYTLFSLVTCGYGLYWVAEKNPDLKHKAEEFLDFRSLSAFEMRYSAQQIMDRNSRDLLAEKGARFLDPELKFYPHLLMEVKDCDPSGNTKESLILWDMSDGEMVIDTHSWEKSHGFADCMSSKAQEHDLKILKILSDNGGACDLATLQTQLKTESTTLEMVLRNTVKKNLIVSTADRKYRIHLEKPKIQTVAQTRWHEPLTTKTHKRSERAKGFYTQSQIEKLAKMAFGEHFSIRKSTEIFLPIHRIVVQDPEGAVQTYHYNAVSGTKLPKAPFYQ